MEQQYTCPFCYQDYTRFTISEHYGCGVEPLEITEEIEQELDAISEEVAEQETLTVNGTDDNELPNDSAENQYVVKASDIMESALRQAGVSAEETKQKEKSEDLSQTKIQPKKRGPKPKIKTVT